jgi:hypothetical protein
VGVIDALKVASEVLHHGFKRLDFPRQRRISPNALNFNDTLLAPLSGRYSGQTNPGLKPWAIDL